MAAMLVFSKKYRGGQKLPFLFIQAISSYSIKNILISCYNKRNEIPTLHKFKKGLDGHDHRFKKSGKNHLH